MESLLVKIFALALALSQVTTTPDAVKTQFDRTRDQEAHLSFGRPTRTSLSVSSRGPPLNTGLASLTNRTSI
jgi:hypothetical protein